MNIFGERLHQFMLCISLINSNAHIPKRVNCTLEICFEYIKAICKRNEWCQTQSQNVSMTTPKGFCCLERHILDNPDVHHKAQLHPNNHP